MMIMTELLRPPSLNGDLGRQTDLKSRALDQSSVESVHGVAPTGSTNPREASQAAACRLRVKPVGTTPDARP